jgi:uncharacterized Zn ribbon protein
MSEKDFESVMCRVKKELMHLKSIFARDVHGNEINVGDTIAKAQSDSLNLYVVCAQSDRVFYLATFKMLISIQNGSITCVQDLKDKADTKLLKQNSNKAVVIHNSDMIYEIVRHRIQALQVEVLNIHKNDH